MTDIDTRSKFLHLFSGKEGTVRATQPPAAVLQHMCSLPGARTRTSEFMAMHRLTGSVNRVLWNNSSSDKKANECDLENSISD